MSNYVGQKYERKRQLELEHAANQAREAQVGPVTAVTAKAKLKWLFYKHSRDMIYGNIHEEGSPFHVDRRLLFQDIRRMKGTRAEDIAKELKWLSWDKLSQTGKEFYLLRMRQQLFYASLDSIRDDLH